MSDTAGDNDYVSRPGQKGDPIPVTASGDGVEDPSTVEEVDPVADSDAQLAKDDTEAIDKSNILDGGRTRGAKPEGGYTEPGDEEGLPTDDGTSAVAK